MGLGRGLASLISRRDTEVSADDVLEQIDTMEFETDSLPAPKKPLVTMLRVDTEEEVTESEPEIEPIPMAMEEVATPPVIQEAVSKMETMKGDAWDQHEDSVQHIALDNISINPLQPRRSFDPRELEDLQESIAQNGILQPLVVARLENGTYELIAGERRLRAARGLRWDKVPCVVRRDVKSDQSRLVYALIENIQRENLNPIEEALAYHQLNKDFGLTHEEIGARMGKSRVGVTNIVRVLQLPQEIQRGLVEGKITMGHAKAILMIPDEDKQIRFYNHLVEEGLTVRKAEIRARRIQRAMNIDDPRRMVNRVKKDPLSLKYGPALEDKYGFHSSVRYEVDRHVFEVVFRAASEDELDQLTGRLLGKYELPGQDLEKDLVGE
ncbi:MAG: ParB/RepB/Spo0J family partition protein [bacterium]|nr:ParB/RepB/Spo0J family partition protein [bacterium]